MKLVSDTFNQILIHCSNYILRLRLCVCVLQTFTAYPARCGHCVSGQTIAMALDELKNHPKSFRAQNYLVNLGTMDILIGRDIYEIEADYHKLIETLLKMNKIPICTTLPPIVVAEDEHEQAVWPQLYQKLLLFNRFLEDLLSKTPIPFIDFWSFFIADDGKPVKPYYQS